MEYFNLSLKKAFKEKPKLILGDNIFGIDLDKCFNLSQFLIMSKLDINVKSKCNVCGK